MNYSEAKQVLEQQEKAKAVLETYTKVANAHQQLGFNTRGELIKALQEIDLAEGGRARRAKGTGKRKRAAKGGRRGQRGLAPEMIAQIQKLKSEGKTNAAISRTTGVSSLTVAKYVKGQAGKTPAPAKKKAPAKAKRAGKGKAKGKGRGQRGLSPETVSEIRKLKAEGKTNAAISRTVGVSALTVAKYVKGQAGKAQTAPAPAASAPAPAASAPAASAPAPAKAQAKVVKRAKTKKARKPRAKKA